MCIAVVCFPVCDVIKFEIYLMPGSHFIKFPNNIQRLRSSEIALNQIGDDCQSSGIVPDQIGDHLFIYLFSLYLTLTFPSLLKTN